MPNFNIKFTTKKQTVPAAAGASRNVQINVMKGADVVRTANVLLPSTAIVFPPLADGTYVVHAQLLTSTNEPIGEAAVSEPVTVVNMIEIDVPDVVTVTIA
jgi:hypothetical protein